MASSGVEEKQLVASLPISSGGGSTLLPLHSGLEPMVSCGTNTPEGSEEDEALGGAGDGVAAVGEAKI